MIPNWGIAAEASCLLIYKIFNLFHRKGQLHVKLSLRIRLPEGYASL
jgi:hypothetical protein